MTPPSSPKAQGIAEPSATLCSYSLKEGDPLPLLGTPCLSRGIMPGLEKAWSKTLTFGPRLPGGGDCTGCPGPHPPPNSQPCPVTMQSLWLWRQMVHPHPRC